MTAGPDTGDKAPDFVIRGAICGTFTLSSQVRSGSVLLYFYPTDYGLMCTYYAERLNEIKGRLDKEGVRMFQISPNTLEEHIGWMARTASEYDHLCDTDQKVSTMYGMLVGPPHPEILPVTNRGFVLIDRKMMIRYIWRASIPADIVDTGVLIAAVRTARGRK
ncbi:MAG: peroxiredoxin family protein [Methanomassiliicoccaceae archaeon]|nr:peroxiredoxin family protein [Methanomassiliicoccaceae archaeon]